MHVTIHEAEANFPQLLAAVERGEEVVISRSDKPVARLIPESAGKVGSKLGFLAGTISEDVIRRLTDPALDRQIEGDFVDSIASGSK